MSPAVPDATATAAVAAAECGGRTAAREECRADAAVRRSGERNAAEELCSAAVRRPVGAAGQSVARCRRSAGERRPEPVKHRPRRAAG